MLTQFIEAAMRHARYEILPDDGSCYAEIPDFRGLWANARTQDEYRVELREVLEDWLLVGLRRNITLPVVKR